MPLVPPKSDQKFTVTELTVSIRTHILLPHLFNFSFKVDTHYKMCTLDHLCGSGTHLASCTVGTGALSRA